MTRAMRPERFDSSGAGFVCAKVTVYERLDDLCTVQKEYGLKHGTISVLRALCSFLPLDTREGECGRTVVWPSNNVLSERANGMPERTLRRHLQKLVECGFIIRRSSANGKRFALRAKGAPVVAFGFDLGPFLDRHQEFKEAVNQYQDEQEQMAILRHEIRQILSEGHIGEQKQQAIKGALRQKGDLKTLLDIMAQIQPREVPTPKMAAKDGKNDRHIQNTKLESKVKKDVGKKNEIGFLKEETSLNECMDVLPISASFSEGPIQSWVTAIELAKKLGPMIGIPQTKYNEAMSWISPKDTAIMILCLVEIHEKLRSPLAYFAELVKRAKIGRFSLKGLLNMTRKNSTILCKEGFAAAN